MTGSLSINFTNLGLVCYSAIVGIMAKHAHWCNPSVHLSIQAQFRDLATGNTDPIYGNQPDGIFEATPKLVGAGVGVA